MMRNEPVIWGLICLAAFTPLAFGTTQPWSIALMELAVLLLTLVYVVPQVAAGTLIVANPRLLALLSLFTLYVFLQAAPLPAALGRLEFLGLPREALSVYPRATQEAALKVLAYLALFFLAVQCFPGRPAAGASSAHPPGVYRFAHFLIFFAFGLSVFALIQHFTFNGKLYWVRELTLGGTPFGPFVNRNHYAGYMELTTPLPLALALAGGVPGDRRPLYLFMSVVMAASLVLSLSRGGILSFLCQMGVMAALFRFAQGPGEGTRSKLLGLGLVGIGLLALIVWLGPEPVWRRLGTLTGGDPAQLFPGRLDVWRDTLRIVAAFPLAGSGLGTFPLLHMVYKTRPTDAVYYEAHNDYLQVLTETGVLGGGLLLLFGLLAAGRALHRLRFERDRTLVGVRIGALTGCAGMAFHSVTDFNLQIPANAVLFFILAGLATMPNIQCGVRSAECGARSAERVNFNSRLRT